MYLGLELELNNLKRKVMTEKEINRLANLIVEKLLGAQQQSDAEFKQEIEGLEELMSNQIADELYKEAQQTYNKVEELKKKFKL